MKSNHETGNRQPRRRKACGIVLCLLLAFLQGSSSFAQSSDAPRFPCSEFLSSLRPKPQHFQVCTDRSTLIHCAGGTEIFIPPHAFVFAENKDTVLDVAKLQIQYQVDPQKPNAVGMKVSDPEDFRKIDKVDVAITEVLDAKSMLLCNLNCNTDDYLLGNAVAVRIKPTCDGQKLKLRKQIIVLLPNPSTTEMASIRGNHNRREFMAWEFLSARSPQDVEAQLFAELPIPQQLPLYLVEGLANPKKLAFADGSSVEYALERGLQHDGYEPDDYVLQLDHGLGDAPPESPDDPLGHRRLQVHIVLGADGLAQHISVLRDGKRIDMALLSIAAAQIQWDVRNWNLKDTLKLRASRMANLPEVFGSGISPEEQAFFAAPNLIQWGKMVHYLAAATGKGRADTLMTMGIAVGNLGWLAFGKWIYPPAKPVQVSVDLTFPFQEAKVFVYLPEAGSLAEVPNPRQGTNLLPPAIPEGSPAKLIVLTHSAAQGPCFSISDFVATNGLLLKPEPNASTWPQIEAALRAL